MERNGPEDSPRVDRANYGADKSGQEHLASGDKNKWPYTRKKKTLKGK